MTNETPMTTPSGAMRFHDFHRDPHDTYIFADGSEGCYGCQAIASAIAAARAEAEQRCIEQHHDLDQSRKDAWASTMAKVYKRADDAEQEAKRLRFVVGGILSETSSAHNGESALFVVATIESMARDVLAAAQPTRCHDCGRKYGDEHGFPDLVIPDDAWKRIAPDWKGNGLLCPSCICQRLHDMGITTTGRFTSGPLAAQPASNETPT